MQCHQAQWNNREADVGLGIRTVVLDSVSYLCSILSIVRIRLFHYGIRRILYYFGFLQVRCSGLGIAVWGVDGMIEFVEEAVVPDSYGILRAPYCLRGLFLTRRGCGSC